MLLDLHLPLVDTKSESDSMLVIGGYNWWTLIDEYVCVCE